MAAPLPVPDASGRRIASSALYCISGSTSGSTGGTVAMPRWVLVMALSIAGPPPPGGRRAALPGAPPPPVARMADTGQSAVGVPVRLGSVPGNGRQRTADSGRTDSVSKVLRRSWPAAWRLVHRENLNATFGLHPNVGPTEVQYVSAHHKLAGPALSATPVAGRPAKRPPAAGGQRHGYMWPARIACKAMHTRRSVRHIRRRQRAPARPV